jgi:hypothetical protein
VSSGIASPPLVMRVVCYLIGRLERVSQRPVMGGPIIDA